MSYFDKVIACAVTAHKWGVDKQLTRLQDYAPTLREQIEAGNIRATQRIFEGEEYQAISRFDTQTGVWCRQNSVPTLLKSGIYGVPIGHLSTWEATLNARITQRTALCEQFYAVYPQRVQEAIAARPGLVHAWFYPSAEQIRQEFGVGVRYLDLNIPIRLEGLNRDIYEAAKAHLLQEIEQTSQHIESTLLKECEELVGGLHDALKGLDDGALKRFHVSHLTKLEEWADLFLQVRNVTGYSQLEQVAKQLKYTVMGRGKELKENATERKSVRETMAQTLVTLKELMEEQPLRNVEFG